MSEVATTREAVDQGAIALAQDRGSAGRVPTGPGRMLFLDATGVLSGFGSSPTGIPRVEDFLVRAALADPDPLVMLVKRGRNGHTYESLNAFERQQLERGLETDQADFNDRELIAAIRRIFQIIRRNPALGRDADRHFADLATNRGRRGFSYQAVKTLIRIYRLYRNLIRQDTAALSTRQNRPVDLSDGVLLLSNKAALSNSLSTSGDSTHDRAFISYDLIPILHPPFAIDADFTGRFAANLGRLMRSHRARALCISETSRAMMTEYAQGAGLGNACIRRFPLPSILWEKAQRHQPSSQQSLDEPYVIYCSTIEARKNHLLLSRIWQQAVDEGATLPKLICVGKWGWRVDELKSYLAAHPALSSRIVFTGPVSDAKLIDYYRGAMFGVVPSRIEGWGYGASECLDFGIPVIVSTAPALHEATQGLMPAIDPDDQAAWYAEIRTLSESEERRALYRKRIAEHYRPTSTAASWAHVKAALLHD